MDEIALTVPRERPFYTVAHLVLGGLAVRLDLTFENLEDLQVALADLLERDLPGRREVTVRVRMLDGALEASVGPVDGPAVRSELERGANDVGLRRILETVVDGVDLQERDGEHWVTLTKALARRDGRAD